MKRKILKKDLNNVEVKFAEEKQKMNSLKTNLQKCLNVRVKLNNLEQVQIVY